MGSDGLLYPGVGFFSFFFFFFPLFCFISFLFGIRAMFCLFIDRVRITCMLIKDTQTFHVYRTQEVTSGGSHIRIYIN